MATVCDWFDLKTNRTVFTGLTLKPVGDSLWRFGVKISDDGFLQFGLKTGGGDFSWFGLKTSSRFLG
jgi:hypothetical protein